MCVGNTSKGWVLIIILVAVNLVMLLFAFEQTLKWTTLTNKHSHASSGAGAEKTRMGLRPPLGIEDQLDNDRRDRELDRERDRARKRPQPMPSVPYVPDKDKGEKSEGAYAKRKKFGYGGDGDGLHLGGFKVSGLDYEGLSNNTFNWMLNRLAVKSIVDLGCGIGASTSYFLEKGVEVLCIEGSHDAVTRSMLPKEVIVEHDFTRGSWWPEATYDALWCVDVLEHVGYHFFHNMLPVFEQSALIFIAASNNGGWHHVEVREAHWWKAMFAARGFVYSEELTQQSRDSAIATTIHNSGGRIYRRMLVFINPAVAKLARHRHVFGGDGCLFEENQNVPCDERFNWFNPSVDRVPMEFQSLINCDYQPLIADRKEANTRPAYGVFKDCVRNPRAFNNQPGPEGVQ